ncbi:DNA-directed DNA polymerase [Tanacetum coccineum]
MNNVQLIDYKVKGVTTRGRKTTTQDVHDNNTDERPEDPPVIDPNKLVGSKEVLTENQPQKTNEPLFQPSSEVQTPPVPFPRRLRKEKDEAQHKKFLENLKQLHINFPFIEALAQMPKYAKFMKRLQTNKARLEEACKITMNKRCSAVLLNKLPSKEKDPGIFTIPCDIGQLHIDNALAYLGASISLMSYTMYEKLGLGEPKATRMSLELADRPFLETTRAMIDVFNKKITLRVGDDEVIFDVDQSINRPTNEDDECYGIDDLDDTINEEERDEVKSEHLYLASANEIDEKKPELKNLPQHLEYAYLHGDKSFPVIISSKLSEKEKMSLLQVLEKRNGAVAWKILDIKGISPSYYSSWVSPIHFVPKKGGMNVVLNDNNELIPSRTITGWRVCIDYRKLNDATQKDHFSLPFIDQLLERLCGNEYYCFLDGFSGFFQIPIAPEDQKKTSFTCPYGTFAYRRMPFGLCNAPATFQRCMTAIFHDMVEDLWKYSWTTSRYLEILLIVVPQPSGPTDIVADEAVHKELGDRLVRAATTASSLEAEQDSGNITKTRSKATPNESSSLGTTSGGGPRCQETIGDTIAQTSLKRMVKKLEQKKRSRTHGLKRLHKVGMSRRVESSSNEEDLGEDASKQGRRMNAIDADEDITLPNVPVNAASAPTNVSAATTTTATIPTPRKGIVITEPELVKPKKKDVQIMLDEEAAKKLQAEFDEEERLAREKDKANIAWDDIQANVDADYQLAERLQAEEQEQFTIKEKATLFKELLEQRRKHFAAKRAEEKRNKPPTKNQQKRP